MRERVLFNARLVDAERDAPGAILVRDGRIAAVTARETALPKTGAAAEYTDCRGLVLTPAFVDMHAHFRYPGQSEKETLESGLKAAVAGGYGTVALMPNTRPPVSDAETAFRIQEEAAAFGLADVIQSVSITQGQKGESAAHLAALSGVPVVSEDGFDVADPALLKEAFRLCAAKTGAARGLAAADRGPQSGPLCACHCEDAFYSREARKHRAAALARLSKAGGIAAALRGESSPEISAAAEELRQANALLARAEDAATARNLGLAEAAAAETAGVRIHICHVSTAASLCRVIRAKQRNRCAVSAEAAPHHLALCAEAGAGLFRLVNPPLRSAADRAALIAGAASGALDAIATDHAPHTAADKEGGAPGFPGLETAFAVCNTVLVKTGAITLQRLFALLSANPARLLGAGAEKGLLREGFLADFALVSPDETWTVDGSRFFTRGKYSPFDGMTLTGRVAAVYRRGEPVFTRGQP